MNTIAHSHGCIGCLRPYVCVHPECNLLGVPLNQDGKPARADLYRVCSICELKTIKSFKSAIAFKDFAVPKKPKERDA